jgi:cold shock CspA family protein
MLKHTNKWNVILAGVAGGVISLAGVAKAAPAGEESEVNAPGGQTRTRLVHTTATVTGMNHATRTADIKTADGEETTVEVPEAVKAFDDMKTGDKVDIDYYQSLAISLAPSGTKPSSSERRGRQVNVGGGLRGREITVSAEVVSVDPAADTVTFKGPKGNLRTVHVENSALQAKLPNLKPGQVVQFDYSEAVAASIRPSEEK